MLGRCDYSSWPCIALALHGIYRRIRRELESLHCIVSASKACKQIHTVPVISGANSFMEQWFEAEETTQWRHLAMSLQCPFLLLPTMIRVLYYLQKEVLNKEFHPKALGESKFWGAGSMKHVHDTPLLCPGRPVRTLAQQSLLFSEVKRAGELYLSSLL